MITWELDIDAYQFTYVSPQIERILGYAPADVIGQPEFWQACIHPEDREWAMRVCMQQSQLSRHFQFEYRFRRADGEYLWLRDYANVVTRDGRPVKLRGVLVDVSEQKAVEQELRASRQQLERVRDELEERVEERAAELRDSQRFLQTIVDNVPVAVFAMSADDLRYRFVNKVFQEEVFGLSEEEILGKDDFAFFAPEQARSYQIRERQMLETGEELEMPEEQVETSRGRRTYHVKETPLRDEQGRVTHALGIAQDVTEMRAVKDALRRYAAELEAANTPLEQEIAEPDRLYSIIDAYTEP